MSLIFLRFLSQNWKKRKKYVKMCKNWKYSKNVKYVPQFEGHLIMSLMSLKLRDIWGTFGTKSSPPLLTLRSSFREGRSFFISIFNRWGKGPNEKNGQITWKIDDFSIFQPSTLNPQPSFFDSSTLNPQPLYSSILWFFVSSTLLNPPRFFGPIHPLSYYSGEMRDLMDDLNKLIQ